MNNYPAHILSDGTVQSCEEHLRNTAKFCNDYLSDVGLPKTGYLCGLIHDAGKLSEQFKNYIIDASSGKDVKKGEIIHSFAAVHIIMNHYFKGYNNEK